LNVRAAREFAVCDANEVALAQVFDAGDFALNSGDLVFYTLDDLIDRVFFPAVIEECRDGDD